jgi:type I restriction enzyme M protein
VFAESAQELSTVFRDNAKALKNGGTPEPDFTEHLSLLVFLKMADEQFQLTGIRVLKEGLDWDSLVTASGPTIETQYRAILDEYAQSPGGLGLLFQKVSNKFNVPAVLHQVVVNLVGSRNWLAMEAEIKGVAYEDLLLMAIHAGGAQAGRHFTPRTVIDAIVAVMEPQPDDTVYDPACGTGGFLLAAHRHVMEFNPVLDPDQRAFLKSHFLTGTDISDRYVRFSMANLLFHGIGSPDSLPNINQGDSPSSHPGRTFALVMTNPEFGTASGVTNLDADGHAEHTSTVPNRDDFWVSTPSKQLNFVQHIKTILNINGRAAAILPDNVLFEAGQGETVRRNLLMECDVHTILRMPTGVFLIPGVKANVVFFDRKPASETPWTKEIWFYDLRTNKHFTPKQNPLTREDLGDFVTVYSAADRSKRVETDRFKRFAYADLISLDKVNLDITWLKDDSESDDADLPGPDALIAEIVEELTATVAELMAAAAPLDATTGESRS